MTGEELKIAAIRLFGEKGWVVSLAENLGVDRTQVWRYVSGRTTVPGPVAAAVECWLSKLPKSIGGGATGGAAEFDSEG